MNELYNMAIIEVIYFCNMSLNYLEYFFGCCQEIAVHETNLLDLLNDHKVMLRISRKLEKSLLYTSFEEEEMERNERERKKTN